MDAAMQARIDRLDLIMDERQQRLIELDAVPVDQRAKATYSVGQQTYDWNGYRASLEAMMAGYAEQRKQMLMQTWAGETVYGVVR